MEPSTSSIVLTYPSIRCIFGSLSFGIRRTLAKSCPDVRKINSKLPHYFRIVEISMEYPCYKLQLDDLVWKVQRTGAPVITTPTRRITSTDKTISVFTATQYFLDRPNTRIHTFCAENCFFRSQYPSFGASRIEILKIKFSFGHTTPFMRMLENIRFRSIYIINISQHATVFNEINNFQTDSLRVATVKISQDSLTDLNFDHLEVYEFDTDAAKFTKFCEKLKTCKVGSSYTADFPWTADGAETVFYALKEAMKAKERYIDKRICLCVKADRTEVNITFEKLGSLEHNKFRFTARVMITGSAKRPSMRKRFSKSVRALLH